MDQLRLVIDTIPTLVWSCRPDGAFDVGVSPVYLTQLFRQVEGLPLYRYQLQRRLARALDRLGERVDGRSSGKRPTCPQRHLLGPAIRGTLARSAGSFWPLHDLL
jgi:hypothetical protein